MRVLSDFLAQIPASFALGISVISNQNGITLRLPYDGNTNHHATVFGGSLVLGATLAGWAVVHEHFKLADGNIVIKKSDIRYLAPAATDVLITANLISDVIQANTILRRFGKVSVDVVCDLCVNDVSVAEFHGVYVVKCNV